jgi:hypothetical protein
VQTLYSGSEKLRSYVAAHAMPVVLLLDPGCAMAMLKRIAAHAKEAAPEPCPRTSRCAALVAVLKVIRTEGRNNPNDAIAHLWKNMCCLRTSMRSGMMQTR